jgi:hypothetical protein
MPTDDVLELVKESFSAEARAITAPPALAADVRRVLRRRRRAGRRTRRVHLEPPGGSPTEPEERPVRVVHVPGSRAGRVSKTCLPGADGGTGAGPRGELRLLVDAPDGTPCVGATIGFTTHPGVVTGKVETPGEQTVFLTACAPGTRRAETSCWTSVRPPSRTTTAAVGTSVDQTRASRSTRATNGSSISKTPDTAPAS